jgi:hypothetical protein
MCTFCISISTPNSTPNSSYSSLSSSNSIISYNANFNNTILHTNINTNSLLLLYTCKFCSNNIGKNTNIYRGYNHSFCSNHCRSKYSQKIALIDYYLNNYDLWL